MVQLNPQMKGDIYLADVHVDVGKAYKDSSAKFVKGSLVVCNYVDPLHRHWDFTKGDVYKVVERDCDGTYYNVPADAAGDAPGRNWGFEFSEVYVRATLVPELVVAGVKLRYADSSKRDWSQSWPVVAGLTLGAEVTVTRGVDRKIDPTIFVQEDPHRFYQSLHHFFIRVDQDVLDALAEKGIQLLLGEFKREEEVEKEEVVVAPSIEDAPFQVGDKVRVIDNGYGFAYREIGYVVTITEVKYGAYVDGMWAFRIAEQYAGNNRPRWCDGWHGAAGVERLFVDHSNASHETCAERGYKVGDKFVILHENMFKLGSIVELVYDDGTEYPKFKVLKGECLNRFEDQAYTHLDRVAKIPVEQFEKEMQAGEVGEVAVAAEAEPEQKTLTRADLSYDRLYVVQGGRTFSAGSIVKLDRDDGTECPLFKLVEGECRYNNATGNLPGGFEYIRVMAPYSNATAVEEAEKAVRDAVAALDSALAALAKVKAVC